MERCEALGIRLVPTQDFKLVDSIYNYIFDYLRDAFLKKIGIPMRIVSAINTVMNLDGYSVIRMILTHFGYLKFVSIVWWLAFIF
jgi:hypothetical protein